MVIVGVFYIVGLVVGVSYYFYVLVVVWFEFGEEGEFFVGGEFVVIWVGNYCYVIGLCDLVYGIV